MNVRGKVVALLMVLALVVGAAGGVAGITVFGNQETLETQDPKTNDPQQGNEQEQKADEPPKATSEDFAKIEQAYTIISDRYVKDIDKQTLIEGAIQGMIDTLKDPYSVYMDAETAQQFSQSLDSSFEGIGAEVNIVDDKVNIVAPIKGSPAEEAGLKPNDKIVEVDGQSVVGMDLYEAVLKIRGEKGSKVDLTIERPGVIDLFTIQVTRDVIPLETVYASTKEYSGKKIGVIQITSFSEKTAEDFKKELTNLEKQGIHGLVIDVRGNPGGYLLAVENIMEEIIPNTKPYIQIEDREGKANKYFSSLDKMKDYPIIGLIDKGSASASEILAAALIEAADYDVVGVTSFGKGTVQQAIPMGEDGSTLKLTLFKWLTPDGNWINEQGVEPTIKVEQPEYFYSSPINIEETLKKDMNSNKIANAQKILKGLGYEPGRVDGYFGEQTEIAVKAFQETNKLPVTGQIDKQTAGIIEQKLIEKIRSEENDFQLQTAIRLLFKK